MDDTLHSIATFAAEAELSAVVPSALELTKLHLADAIACGAGAFASETARKLRRSVGPTSGAGASAYGMAATTSPELAAFANASMNRLLDFNDFGPAGHPSDMMPAQLAMAESVGGSGADVLRGIVVAYEVATAMADTAPFTEIPWDVGLYDAVGAAAGMASVLRLDVEAAANAVSLALVPSLPLRVTRQSPVSEWRSSATAHACMTATFACRLAAAGLTGPAEPFEGKNGLNEALGRHLELLLREGGDRAPGSAITRGSLKRYQACFLAQSAIDAARRVARRVDVSRIDRVRVDTTEDTWSYVGGGAGDAAQKWDPPSREVADHSIPYILAHVFLDGGVDHATYSDEERRARRWEPMIGRIEVVADDALAEGPIAPSNPARVTVTLCDGSTDSELSTFPYDDAGAPTVGAADVREKFAELAGRVLPDSDVEQLYETLVTLDGAAGLQDLGHLLRSFSERP